LPWTASAPSAPLMLSSRPSAGGDASLVLDAVAVIRRASAEVLIANPSFEASGTYVPAPGYVYPIAGWNKVGAGNPAINASGGAFLDNGVVPEGINVLALQNALAVEQAIAGLT